MTDIPLANAQIIWRPEDPSLPSVKVVGIPGSDDDRRYASSWGACNIEFAQADTAARLAMLFRRFAYLTGIDGVDAGQLHDALMQVPEYRRDMADNGFVDPALAA